MKNDWKIINSVERKMERNGKKYQLVESRPILNTLFFSWRCNFPLKWSTTYWNLWSDLPPFLLSHYYIFSLSQSRWLEVNFIITLALSYTQLFCFTIYIFHCCYPAVNFINVLHARFLYQIKKKLQSWNATTRKLRDLILYKKRRA